MHSTDSPTDYLLKLLFFNPFKPEITRRWRACYFSIPTIPTNAQRSIFLEVFLMWKTYNRDGKAMQCPPCSAKGPLPWVTYKHVPEYVAHRTLPVAFTRLFQGNFLALKTRATVTVVTTVDLHLSKTLEMLPQYTPRSSTFSYVRIGKGRGVRGTEAVMGPWCWEPGVYAGNYTGTL